MAKQALKYVGQSVPRVDGIEKVTGKAKFLGDLVIPGMLHGKIFRSPYPHARILSVDASKAEALPGVAAVLTAAEAISLIDVQYEELPAAVGIDAARAPGASLIHEDRSDNICSHERVERG